MLFHFGSSRKFRDALLGAPRDMGADGHPPPTLASLREELTKRDELFEIENGEKSSRAVIAADEEWERVYQKLKDAEFQVAQNERIPGQCGQYISRRRRFCASRAADGKHGVCSLHAPDLSRKTVSRPEGSGVGKDEGDVEVDGKSSDAAAARKDQKPNTKKTNIHRRMKKLTNPMSIQHRKSATCPIWTELYSNPSLPLFIDIGCAKGRFLQRAASVDCERFESCVGGKHNLLGLEIYEPLVSQANLWVNSHEKTGEPVVGDAGNTETYTKASNPSKINNLHFVACNANVTLPTWYEYRDDKKFKMPKISFVSILFPDPWSRKKHAGRRVVTEQFVNVLADVLEPGTKVYCCSDVKPLAQEMQSLLIGNAFFTMDEASFEKFGEAEEKELVEKSKSRSEVASSTGSINSTESPNAFNHIFPAHQYEWQAVPTEETCEKTADETVDGNAFTFSTCEKPRWLASNPLGVPTERDLVCEGKWRPVFRFVVVKV